MSTHFNKSLENCTSFKVVHKGTALSCEEILAASKKLCLLFEEKGIEPGTKILLKSKNSPAHLITFLACEKKQLIYVPVFSEITEDEFKQIKNELGSHCEIKFNTIDETAVSNLYFENHQQKESDNVLSGCLFRTSGTTGDSIYIYHTFENIWNNAGITAREQEINDKSTILSILTFSHMGGFNMQATAAMRVGSSIKISDSKNTEELIKEISECTHTILVPSAVRILSQYCENKKIILKNKPTVVTGSTAISNQTVKEMLGMGLKVQIVYGLTEIGPYVCRLKINDLFEIPKGEFCIGKPCPEYEFELDKENSEILISGPCGGKKYNTTKGEINDLPTTNSKLKTGDLGEIVEGYYYFKGRNSQYINVGGFKVSPQDIEAVIMTVPTVKACVVLSEKNYSVGEVPVAYVVASEQNAEIINLKIREKLARHKWPRKIVFVDELPQTSIGKIRRTKLSIRTENK